ncbi:MAG: hypothetical protein V4543_00685 [Bacteroidota bacterium]
MNVSSVISVVVAKGWRVFTRPFELNIVGIRSANLRSNRFDDVMCVFWKDDAGTWQGRQYACTTDPGTFWLENPMQPQGTAFVCEGQFIDCWSQGLHRNQYKALVQRGPMNIVRGLARAEGIDWGNAKVIRGVYGIDLHRALRSGTSYTVDEHSAGCQVLAEAEDFAELMQLADIHASRYGNHFSYSLVDYRLLRRSQNLTLGLTALFIGSLLALLATQFFDEDIGSAGKPGNLKGPEPDALKPKPKKRKPKKNVNSKATI